MIPEVQRAMVSLQIHIKKKQRDDEIVFKSSAVDTGQSRSGVGLNRLCLRLTECRGVNPGADCAGTLMSVPGG